MINFYIKMMATICIVICSLVCGQLHAADQLYTQQSPVTPELATVKQHPVGVTTFVITNPQQFNPADFSKFEDRRLTLEVWYPALPEEQAELATYSDVTRSNKAFTLQGNAYRDAVPIATQEKFPLVVFSHGYTGYRTIMFYLAEHLASNGYVVASIDHTDSTNADVIASGSPFSGFPSTLINRARDQQFVLESFRKFDTTLAAITDTERAAVVGHSMGGYGAISTVGGCYSFTNEVLQQFGITEEMAVILLPLFNTCNAARSEADSAWKAMIAFAPWGGELKVHARDSLNNIAIPVLYVAGEEDDISGYKRGVKKLYEATGTASKEKQTYMLVYENARHNIATHPAPKIAYDTELDIGHYYEPTWNIETINRINEHFSLAFLDCHLKQTNACDYLPKRKNVTQVKLNDGKLTEPWPGFKPRWGTGLKFYQH